MGILLFPVTCACEIPHRIPSCIAMLTHIPILIPSRIHIPCRLSIPSRFSIPSRISLPCRISIHSRISIPIRMFKFSLILLRILSSCLLAPQPPLCCPPWTPQLTRATTSSSSRAAPGTPNTLFQRTDLPYPPSRL